MILSSVSFRVFRGLPFRTASSTPDLAQRPRTMPLPYTRHLSDPDVMGCPQSARRAAKIVANAVRLA